MHRPAIGLLLLLAAPPAAAFELTSSAFDAGDAIPVAHGCDGVDRSPQLAWKDAPAGSKGFALVCDDPDAPGGDWVHWVIYDIPAATSALPEGVPPTPTLADGSRQGTNDFRRLGYGGPCPPRGASHRYVFRLYALDTVLDLAPGATKAELTRAVADHTRGRVELIGRYARR